MTSNYAQTTRRPQLYALLAEYETSLSPESLAKLLRGILEALDADRYRADTVARAANVRFVRASSWFPGPSGVFAAPVFTHSGEGPDA